MSTANEYHNATKYAPETIGQGPGVDWAAQPSPYKEFHSNTRVDLGSHLLLARDADSDQPRLLPLDEHSPDYEISRLSTLLLHTNGVTAQQPTRQDPMYFRAAPSAGALYPTEIYVAIRDTAGIEDGIYNFQVKDHSLAPVLEGNFFPDLEAHCGQAEAITKAKIVVLFSVVFLRSSWRYHDRAYRRILLDSGHVLGNLMIFGPEMDYVPTPITGFNEAAIDELMFFNRDQESTLLLVALNNEPTGDQQLAIGTVPVSWGDDDPNIQMHRASSMVSSTIERAAPLAPSLIEGTDAQLTFALSRKLIDWQNELSTTILLRRSTRSFSAPQMTSEELGMILGFAYRGVQENAHSDFLDPARLKTFIAVHQVDGLEAGLYRYDPYVSRLLLIRRGHFGSENHEIGLGQELCRDAAALVYHFADLDDAFAAFGDRSYRYLNLDAGHIGQRINLAALKLDLGVSGIGGYFDDMANELFSRPASEGLIYLTCIGTPA